MNDQEKPALAYLCITKPTEKRTEKRSENAWKSARKSNCGVGFVTARDIRQ
jgi:hypothetical protein